MICLSPTQEKEDDCYGILWYHTILFSSIKTRFSTMGTRLFMINIHSASGGFQDHFRVNSPDSQDVVILLLSFSFPLRKVVLAFPIYFCFCLFILLYIRVLHCILSLHSLFCLYKVVVFRLKGIGFYPLSITPQQI